MKKAFIIYVVIIGFCAGSSSFAGGPTVGGFEQFHPNQVTENHIGAGWGHKSMTYGMMNLMSGMTTQVAKIMRSGKASHEMNKRLTEILDHVVSDSIILGMRTIVYLNADVKR